MSITNCNCMKINTAQIVSDCEIFAEVKKLLASMLSEMDRLTGYQRYVFMQDEARSHTANETVRFLNQQRYLTLLQPNMWSPNSPDLNPVNYCVWSALERNVYRGRRFENAIELKKSNSSRVGNNFPNGNQ